MLAPLTQDKPPTFGHISGIAKGYGGIVDYVSDKKGTVQQKQNYDELSKYQ